MELQPNELMIGDWVMYDEFIDKSMNHPVKITHLDKDSVITKHYYPILLTPEILEKNGFIKASMISDTPPYDKDEEGNMHFSLNEKFWGWWQPNNTFLIPANGLGWLEFKYIHELQHILKLIGIEKEVIL